jgi:hypothetical protein
MIPGPLLVVPNDVAASIFVDVMHIVRAVCVVGARQRFGRTTNAQPDTDVDPDDAARSSASTWRQGGC